MTLEEALRVIMNELGDIRVPAIFAQDIGVPINHSINNIAECIKAIQIANQKNLEAQKAQEEQEAQEADPEGESDERAADA